MAIIEQPFHYWRKSRMNIPRLEGMLSTDTLFLGDSKSSDVPR